MLDVGIIEPVEESEWISPMVVQDKKTSEVRICVNLKKLNDSCMHDLFLMPFTDEVLEGVCDQEMYSFTCGFFGYHQIRIAKEDRHKMTFLTEWGCFHTHNSFRVEECACDIFPGCSRHIQIFH